MGAIDEIKFTGDLVTKILRTDTRSRGDDKYLTFRVMQSVLRQTGDQVTITLGDLARMPAFETVKRVRAKIQNEKGLFLPDRDAQQRRKERAEAFRSWTSGVQGEFF